jgi:hypothetical protein
MRRVALAVLALLAFTTPGHALEFHGTLTYEFSGVCFINTCVPSEEIVEEFAVSGIAHARATLLPDEFGGGLELAIEAVDGSLLIGVSAGVDPSSGNVPEEFGAAITWGPVLTTVGRSLFIDVDDASGRIELGELPHSIGISLGVRSRTIHEGVHGGDWHFGGGLSGTLRAVPEPGTLLLLALGSVSLAALRRR